MTLRLSELQHQLHTGPGVYFVLSDPLTRAQFDRVSAAFIGLGARRVGSPMPEEHWAALVERAAGRAPWSSLVPQYTGPDDTAEGIGRVRASVQFIDNILSVRPYTAFELEGLTYTLDIFNPCDELKLGYAGAGEPVLLLLMRGPEPAATRDHLVDYESFYHVVAAMDRTLAPRYIRAERSFSPIALAYTGGTFPLERSPWDLLFGLSVLNRPLGEIPTELGRYCAKVESWPERRTLIQVMPGMSAILAAEHLTAARVLGMTAVQELVPGAYDRTSGQMAEMLKNSARGALTSATETSIPSDWPTPLQLDGTAPPSIQLVNSGNPAVVRQALYQVKAAAALQTEGHSVSAFQVSLTGHRVRLTIPLVLARQSGPDACVYTQCEAWTPQRMAALQAWIRDLREESDSDVIVVSREPSDTVAALPEVTEFIHLPFEHLPESQ